MKRINLNFEVLVNEMATSVHDLVLLPQVGKTFDDLQRQILHNSTVKAMDHLIAQNKYS